MRIAVTRSIFGTGLVAGVFGQTTIGHHLREVESAIQTTGQVADVDIEGELLVKESEDLIVGVVTSHQINTRADVRLRAGGNEVKSERISAGGDTVRLFVFSAVQSTVCSASNCVGAVLGVPGVTCVTIGVSTNIVQPTPVGI